MSDYSSRVPVILKDAYTVFFERYRGLTFIHCDVRRWTPGSRKALKQDFDLLCSLHEQPIFAVHELGDTKHLKFLTLFGFRLLTSDGGGALFVKDNDGN